MGDGRGLPPLVNTSAVWRHAWHAVLPSEEATDHAPTQVWVAGEPWVVVRLDERVTAFADRCPHRLAPLSAGRVVGAEDGSARLACGYHGWRFDGEGRCDLIPALGDAGRPSPRIALRRPAGLTEAYGLVWLAPDEPLTPLPTFPEWGDPAADQARCRFVRTKAGAAQLIDNFLDAAHFPFVHAATFGVDDPEPLLGGDITVDGMVVTATFTTPYRDRGTVHTHLVTKTAGVSTGVHVRLELPDATIGILLACLPETADSTRVFKLVTRDDLGGDAGRVEDFVKDEDRITAEDLAILERYPSAELPLDPRGERHTRADRLGLAWRAAMADAVRAAAERETAPGGA